MARPKKVSNTDNTVIEQTEVTKNVISSTSPKNQEAYDSYLHTIELYKVQNPVKYEQKKESFLKRLASL